MGHKYGLPAPERQISEESAYPEIMKLLQRYNINVDAMKDKQKETAIAIIDTVLDEFKCGNLAVKEGEDRTIKVVQYIKNPSPKSTVKELVYAEMKMEHQISMNPEGSQYQRMCDLLCAMVETQGGHAVIKDLQSADAKTAEALALLFLL